MTRVCLCSIFLSPNLKVILFKYGRIKNIILYIISISVSNYDIKKDIIQYKTCEHNN